uniref:Thioredoxin n=1 Tax=Bangiopsis subsimplex TaxID=139980 RepID=A0A1C9CCL3_9RHOD|nr:thioredoxin [Bangiopsis subsimplex]AOM66133.1 thioredoxin [Bangiopsis subsimplex]ARO90310.1 thioredoxin [Bangiopsis subsimplex]
MQVNDCSFKTEIINSDTLVLVSFWAPWCMPCKMLVPIWEDIYKEYSEIIKIIKINTDFNPTTTMEYNIKSIPTLIFFKKGKLLTRITGAIPKSTIIQIIKEFL